MASIGHNVVTGISSLKMAADPQQLKLICRVVWLCIAWYIISSSNNVIGKTLLTDFQYPVTVTMVQLLTQALLCGPLFAAWRVRPLVHLEWKYYMKMILPLAFGKFISSVFSHISLWKVPVSYAHTVKGTMPLFTVVLSRLILGETQTIMVYLSLVPIICGVLVASVTEISFDTIGLVSALISTLGFSLQNIFSKKVLRDTGVHHLRLLHLLAKLSLWMFFPIWLFYDLRRIMTDSVVVSNNGDLFFSIFLLALDGILNFAQNIVAFSVLNLVAPLTYSVCNATKRISVILFSLIMLRNPVTPTNVFGMMLAVVGVLGYNKAKYDAIQAKKGEAVLPTTVTLPPSYLLANLTVPQVTLVPNGKEHHYSNGTVPGKRFS